MRTTRRIRLVLLALFLLALVPPPPVPARAEPRRFHGELRYTVRGPGAAPGGIANAMLTPLAGGVAVGRMTAGLTPLLRAALSMSNEPSIQQVNSMLSQGVPIDMAAILPISASYFADVEFILVEGKDKQLVLESGTLRWSNHNNTSFEYESGSVVDSFRGSGDYALNPATDQITVTFLKGDPPMYRFEVGITHPMPTVGQSTWNALGGAYTQWLQSDGSHYTMGGQMLGETFPEERVGGTTDTGTIRYWHTAPATELRGLETWRNPLDAQVFARYVITDGCIVRIISPRDMERRVFTANRPGTLEGYLEAEIIPRKYENALSWYIEEISDSTLTLDPESARGRIVWFRYEGLPSRNGSMGRKSIRLTVDTSIAPDCQPRQRIDLVVLYPRDASNNPDGTVPNWFYYWKQTSAAQGRENHLLYDAACTKSLGYYPGTDNPPQANTIVICRGMETHGFRDYNRVLKRSTYGIDVFAVTVTHEWTHRDDFHDWWGSPPTYDPARDQDDDLVPDDREAEYGLDPKKEDTHGKLGRDCEWTALRSEDAWTIGWANGEDWAHPGKNSGGR